MDEALVVFVRGIIGFFTLLIFTRALGKHQIGQLTFFDYVLGITIGSIAASLTTDLSSGAWPHWIGLLTWAGSCFILQYISIIWRRVSKYIDGEPTIVIMNGKIMEKTMRKMRYRGDDLLVQLRSKGVFDLSEVEFAILETNGQLSVQKKAQYLPVTPKDLSIPVNYNGISTELIYSGVIYDQNLKGVGHDRDWLMTQLKNHGINSPSEVFIATINAQGELYISKYDDQVDNFIDISDFKGPQ